MIRFFKYETPIQAFAVFIIIMATRVPLFFIGHPILDDEVRNLAIGDKLGDGYLLYRDMLSSTPPLPALLFYLIDIVVGKSREAYAFIALIIIFIQSVIFKNVIDDHELLPAKSYYPALAYILLTGFLYEFTILSEVLIGLTFILLALQSTLRIIRTEGEENRLFSIGFYCSLAFLSFQPFIISIVIYFIFLLLFTRLNISQYLLLMVGFIFPILTLLTFYALHDSLYDFYQCYLTRIFTFNSDILINTYNLSIYLIPVYMLLFLSILSNFTYGRFTNYQLVGRQIFFISLFIYLGVLVYFTKLKTEHLIVLVPFASYFLCSLMIIFKRKKLIELFLWLILLYPAPFLLGYIHKQWAVFHSQYLDECISHIQNKKVLHLGNNLCYYKYNKPATKFFDWEISHRRLIQTDRYAYIVEISQTFEQDMPDVIVDNENVLSAVFERIPWLAARYKMVTPGTYYLIQ
ncbi:MAG: hypothetical protein NW207_00525 [Cytophagales bacterium]|nr:hypothetical protein [Cytophagales bacterium]